MMLQYAAQFVPCQDGRQRHGATETACNQSVWAGVFAVRYHRHVSNCSNTGNISSILYAYVYICLYTKFHWLISYSKVKATDHFQKADIFYTTPYLLHSAEVLLEKLTGLQLVKKLPAFHGTRRFITALTSVRQLSLS